MIQTARAHRRARPSDGDPAELLAELRGLLHDAEAWVRVEGGDAADEAVVRLREALARDAVPA